MSSFPATACAVAEAPGVRSLGQKRVHRDDIRHEIVWELTPDHRSKYKLLGGMGGRHGTAVLVLTHNRAQQRPDRVVNAAPPEVETVDLEFPARSGLQAELKTAGFRLRWVREEQAARRREQGWEAVVVERDGRRLTFKVPPDYRVSGAGAVGATRSACSPIVDLSMSGPSTGRCGRGSQRPQPARMHFHFRTVVHAGRLARIVSASTSFAIHRQSAAARVYSM
jgi:hypothetical protein